MKPNVEIVDGRFKTILAVRVGAILLHSDWPLGVAARNLEAGEIIKYSSYKNTEDVIIKVGVR